MSILSSSFRYSFFVFLLLIYLPIQAQRINWEEGPEETYVFEISNEEAFTLLNDNPKSGQVKNMLHTPVGAFTGEWLDKPDKGHFIFARIYKNTINYHYYPVIPFQVFLFKEYGVLTLQVVDRNGVIRRDAKVRLNKKRLYYDSASQTYTVNDESEKEMRILTVELQGFRAVFDLRKHLVRNIWNRDDDNEDRPDFYSYMITDKNKYKPGESVRFKSYALTGNRRPIKSNLELWLRKDRINYIKIGEVEPYHPGGFAGEFHLHDSLKLRLDQNYSIRLQDKQGKIAASTGFRYEDYELFGNKLDIKLDTKIHYYPNTNKLEIKATDANGLFLPDMRAEVTIKRRGVQRTYVDLFVLPDTLYYERVDLDSSTPTVIEIPASMFGEADCGYDVDVLVLSYDNQRMRKSESAMFYRSSYKVEQAIVGNKVRFSFSELGVEKKVEAELSYDDGQQKKRIVLPYEETFNQSLLKYNINVLKPQCYSSYNTSWMRSGLELKGGIVGGTLDLTLENPLGLEMTWYAYEGNVMIQKGAGKKFDFKKHKPVDEKQTYYIEIFYFMGGQEQVYRKTYTTKPEHLMVDVDLPERIYPGQTVHSTIKVSDYTGRPVSGVDLTAFSYNSQLNYYIPDLPYLGDQPSTREQRATYSMSQKTYSYSTSLDYSYWNDRANLSAMEYYQFTYPLGRMYKRVIETPDSITQFAPYVMNHGNSENIYVIEVDDRPVYYSWTQQPCAYSFPISGDTAHKVTLRLYDRAVVFDSLYFETGKKTLFSIDVNRLPDQAKIVRLGNRFTAKEIERYQKTIARFPAPREGDYAYFRKDSTNYLIFQSTFTPRKPILAGPIPEGYASYNGNVRYRHQGGYNYMFEDNIVYKEPDQKWMPSLMRTMDTKFQNINDFYLSPKVLKKRVEENKRRGYMWYPSAIHIAQQQVELHIKLPVEKDSTGVANLLFQQVDSGKIVFPDRMEYGKRKFSQMPLGTYNIIVLYNNGKYLKRDSITIKPHTYVALDMHAAQVCEEDSLSVKWLLLGGHSAEIAGRELTYRYSNNEGNIRYMLYSAPQGQAENVTGYVYDTNGEPVVGASIVIKGTSYGTISDLDGYFSIQMDGYHNVLQISYIGYKTKEVTITSQTRLSIVMEEDDMVLDEVVVMAYGVSRKASYTGSVSTVSTERPTKAPEEEVEEIEDEVSTKEAEEQLYSELLLLNGIRRNFSDVGFWEPRLYTDRKGKAEFTTTFPDNITKWEAVVYAMNRRLMTGTARKSIRSFKPLMAELKTPQFLTVGDSCYLAGTIRNYTQDESIWGKVNFMLGQDTLMDKRVTFENSHNEKLLVNVADADSITASYLFRRDDGYLDGEERTIPVVQQGTELAKGTLGFLRNGEALSFKAENNEELYVSVTGNQLDIYMDATNYLRGYKYACNEQLASKLIGLMNYRLYVQYMGETFKYDKEVKQIINRLVDNQNDERLWSWWGRSSNTSFWMSAHIIRALAMAKKAGYDVNLNLSEVQNNYVYLTPYRSMRLSDIETLHALSGLGMKENYMAATDTLMKMVRSYELYEDSIVKKDRNYRPRSFLKEKLLLWEIKQSQNAENIGDSLRPYLKEDVLGRVYCDDGKRPYSWYANELINTLIAYRIVKNDSSLVHLKVPMQMYILASKAAGWNTYQASSAVGSIFPDLLSESSTKDHIATMAVGGKENGRVSTFPYETKLKQGEHITFEKQDGVPLIYSAYSYKRVTEENVGKTFEVVTELNQDRLTAGIPVQLTVTLEVKQKGAEYVMIEVPIPAGCSYNSKRQHFGYYYSGRETHREYFKERTVIFCQELPVGKYTYTIELLPRYTGNYVLNPAKVELMYFPVINANNALREVIVSERAE